MVLAAPAWMRASCAAVSGSTRSMKNVGTFYSTMPVGFYDTFKNFLREWSHRFPHDEDI
jgi:hypothetical protein